MRFKTLLILPLLVASLQAGIIYVDKDAAEGGDGTSWVTAHKYLNDALNESDIRSETHQIWIAEGTYYTDEGDLYANDDQNSKFVIPYTVTAVIGGFVGTEESADAADPARYLTTLSGLVFEEYGATGIGSSYLLETEAGTSTLLIKGFTVSNSSDQSGCLININNSTDRIQTTFEQCNFLDNESTQTLIVTGSSNTVLFRNCRFERCQTSGGYLILYGNFESCYFNQNNSQYSMLYRPGTIDRCFISDNTTTSNSQPLIDDPSNVFSSLLYRNVTGSRIIYANDKQLQLLHSTFIDNYNYSSGSEITGSVTVGNCLFFRSSINHSSILASATVGYKSTVNLPVQSAFFGIFDYYEVGTSNNFSVSLAFAANQAPYTGSSVFEAGFFEKYEAEIPSGQQYGYPSPEQLNGQSYSEFLTSMRSMHGRILDHAAYDDSYAPELTPIVLPDLVIPDPFVNSSDPLGPDGQPFTEDDGLRLDPNSQWASEVINVTTITADYELYDILGNPRIVGGSVDLGAYEYAPIQDADGDGISDANDDFPNNPNETLDTDGDGLGDNQDSDDDGDGVDDSVEIAAGTNPKQYNTAFYNFVQTLGAGAFDADDLAESRLAGQSDVTSEPSLFNLYTLAQVSSANAAGRTQGQSDVTSDPNSFSLYSVEDYNLAQTNSRSLGQQDVVTSPLSYGLYSPSYVTSLLNSSRTAGQGDVIGNPSQYGLFTDFDLNDAQTSSRTEGQQDVTNNPSQFGLFTSSDLNDAQTSSRTLGQQDVINSPSAYNLMGAEGVFDMRVSQPGISTSGDKASMNFTIQSSSDLEQWNNEETIRREYTMPSDKNFMRVSVGPQLEPEPLVAIATDTYGDRLVYDEFNNLYVNDENTPLKIDGENLRTDTYSGWNFYAIESTDSGYLCLLKKTDRYMIITFGLDGNYLSISFNIDHSAYEDDFGQSLD